MKTFSAYFQQKQSLDSIAREQLIPAVKASMRGVVVLMCAVLAAILIVTLSVWVTGMEIDPYLGAGTWGLGFIFLGFAVDNHGPAALVQMTSGVALLILAILQNSVSPDFFIISGALVASWVVVLLFKRVSV